MRRYPRNMQGYGGRPPAADWPGGARIAVQFVLNYEEGGENSILHGDAASEAFLSEIVGAAPWPGMRHWNMELIYEYGARAGFWRLHDLFIARGVPVTVYGVATALARSPAQVAAMQDAGWEIASHGLKWIDYRDYTREAEAADMAEAIRLHTEVTGERPVRLVHRPLLGQHRRPRHRGRRLRLGLGRLRRRPALLARARRPPAADHPLHARRQRHALRHAAGVQRGRPVLRLPQGQLRHALRRRRGRRAQDDVGRPALPPGRPSRPRRGAGAVRRLRPRSRPRSGSRPGSQIARHWAARHPAPGTGERASAMAARGLRRSLRRRVRALALGRRTRHALELGPAHDTAGGLHNALARVFRSASEAERLGVLTAHPDLAGKLAAAKRLTPESTAEQAGAGLDALTDAERARFTELNDAYVAKFGFPVHHRRAGPRPRPTSSQAFETRVANDRDGRVRDRLRARWSASPCCGCATCCPNDRTRPPLDQDPARHPRRRRGGRRRRRGRRIVELVPAGGAPAAPGDGLRRLAPRRPAGSRQHAPPLLPDPDPRPSATRSTRSCSPGSRRSTRSGRA